MTEFDSIVDKLTDHKVVFLYTQKICKRKKTKELERVKYSNISYFINLFH